MSKIIAISLLLYTHIGWTTEEISLSRAETLLAEDIQRAPGALKSFSRKTRMYHYFKPYVVDNELYVTYQTPNMRNGLQGQIKYDLSHFAGAFWNPQIINNKYINAGPGLYLAIDPLVSESFGHSYYILDFPRDTRYLDLTDATWSDLSKIKVRLETLKALSQENILPLMQRKELGFGKGYFSRIALQNMVIPRNSKFRKSIERVFRALGITLIEYSWERSLVKPLCNKAPLSSFVYIGFGPYVDQDQQQVFNRARIDESIDAFFGSNYFVREYSSQEQEIINLTKKFKAALQKKNINLLTVVEQNELRSLTYLCEGMP